MMEICHYTSIIYADYCFFSKVGTLSRSGHIIQGGCTCTFSPLPHPLPPPCLPFLSPHLWTKYLVKKELRKTINEMAGNIPGEFSAWDFFGEIFQGGVSWVEIFQGEILF